MTAGRRFPASYRQPVPPSPRRPPRRPRRRPWAIPHRATRACRAAVEGATGTVANADLAYGLPTGATFNSEDLWHEIQGVTRFEGKWYFHRSNGYDNGRLLQATPGTVDGTSRLVGNAKTLESAFGPEELYLAHGRGDGFPPQLRSLSEHAPSKCGACKREVYGYNMAEVISDFG